MSKRRWLVAIVAALALLLLVGRVVAGWYVDYMWYEALGAGDVWRAKASNLVLMRGGAFVIGTLFVFLNLLAVRHSIRKVVLPRRVGNVEFGEEVSGRFLLAAVAALSLVIGAFLAMPYDDWISLEAARHAPLFGETDPYFRFDLAFWLSWLPLESAVHVWSLIGLVAVTLVVLFLYALTGSLRWDEGRLQVSGYVRRHLFWLGAILLLLLAWSYRLDAYGLLHNGSGALGAFSSVDHRIGLPTTMVLSVLAIAAAMLVAWSGWTGQIRAAFITLTLMLLLALTGRQIVPIIAERFVTPADPELRERPYREIRNGYTRRAYDVDRLTRGPAPAAAPSLAEAVRGASLWDGAALARVIGRPREAATPNGDLGWDQQDGRLLALVVEQPTGPDAADARPEWGVVRVAADVTDDRGAPLPRDDPTSFGGSDLPPVLVHDAATSYFLLADSAGQVAAPVVESFLVRLAHAWHLQNPGLLRDRRGSGTVRLMLRRDVRARLRALYPFFTQGDGILPLVWRDSLFWTVHLYATSDWYPLSQVMRFRDADVRFLRHGATALVNAHTGVTTAIRDENPDSLSAFWMRRFPSLFTDPAAVDGDLARRLAPPVGWGIIAAQAFAQVGVRGEFVPPSHLPRRGADTLFTLATTPPYVESASRTLAISFPLLDPSDRVRGVVTISGGASPQPRWEPLPEPGPHWQVMSETLQRAGDSLRAQARNTRLLPGAIRVIPSMGGLLAVQTHYSVRPDGTPLVMFVALLRDDHAAVGTTLGGAAGMPLPVAPPGPLTPEEFRARIQGLYEAMRDAMRRGDWAAFGSAYETLGRLLRAPQ